MFDRTIQVKSFVFDKEAFATVVSPSKRLFRSKLAYFQKKSYRIMKMRFPYLSNFSVWTHHCNENT